MNLSLLWSLFKVMAEPFLPIVIGLSIINVTLLVIRKVIEPQRSFHGYEVPFTAVLEDRPYHLSSSDDYEQEEYTSGDPVKCRFCGKRYADYNCPYCGGTN